MKKPFVYISVIVLFFSVLRAGDWQELSKVVASDRDSLNCFGQSVSISGNYAIVGAPYEKEDAGNSNTLNSAGAAYIFVRNGTSWAELQKIVPTDRAAGDEFGTYVSISGDWAIVGAPFEDEDASGGDTKSNAGSAYLFHRSGDTWTQFQKIVATDRNAADMFAFSVSISGNYAVAGSYNQKYDATGGGTAMNQAGAAYIFYYNGSSWDQQQKVVASDRAAGDLFGYSVSISDDHVIVGADAEDHDATGEVYIMNTGSAYIFNRSGSTWSQQQKIVASDRAYADDFGHCVAISGNYAIVGAYYEDEDADYANTLSNAGSAYIFFYNSSSWVQQQKIVASDRAASDYYGRTVAISGDRAIVGTINEDQDASGHITMSNAGSVYIYSRIDSTWTQEQKIVASDRAADDAFGNGIAIDGSYLVVGAPNEDDDENGANPSLNSGSSYFFVNSIDVPTPIELSDFIVNYEHGAIQLTWITESEINNLGFAIEKKIMNKDEWVHVADYSQSHDLLGQGNSTEQNVYHFSDDHVVPGMTYLYRLGDVDFGQNLTWRSMVEITIDNDLINNDKDFVLGNAFPNPGNPGTTIEFDIYKDSEVRLAIYDMSGRLQETLVDGYRLAGAYQVRWDASTYSSGLYIYRLECGEKHVSRKMVVIK